MHPGPRVGDGIAAPYLEKKSTSFACTLFDLALDFPPFCVTIGFVGDQ